MIVYADILIFLNTIINFLLLKITARLCALKYPFLRVVAAAFSGGLFSLYILLPQINIITEILVKIIVSAIMSVIAFGFKDIKSLIKSILIMFCLSFVFAGLMIAFWYAFKPKNLIINNGIVYLDISPFLLIIISILAYFFVSAVMYVLRRSIKGNNFCYIKLFCDEKSYEVKAILDTGHNLTDTLSGAPVIIIDEKVSLKLFGKTSITAPSFNQNSFSGRFRVIPYNTVGNSGILPAYKCDYATAEYDGKRVKITNIIAAISNQGFGSDYNAIINPNILTE